MSEAPSKYEEPENCGLAVAGLIKSANELLDNGHSQTSVDFAVTHQLLKIVGQLEGQMMGVRPEIPMMRTEINWCKRRINEIAAGGETTT